MSHFSMETMTPSGSTRKEERKAMFSSALDKNMYKTWEEGQSNLVDAIFSGHHASRVGGEPHIQLVQSCL